MVTSDAPHRQRLAALLAGLGAARGEAAALAVLALGALAGLGLLWWAQRPPQPAGPSGEPVVEADGALPADPAVGADGGLAEVAGEPVVVHVAGLVRAPGLHRLPSGARVADALDAAGGALPGAWLEGLNLARRVDDGEQLLVPAAAEPGGHPAPVAGASPEGSAGGASGPAGGGLGPDGVVSLNRATSAELEALPGIGPVMARRIVEHREEQGPFRAVEQLRDVRGIGDKTLAGLADLVRP